MEWYELGIAAKRGQHYASTSRIALATRDLAEFDADVSVRILQKICEILKFSLVIDCSIC